MKSQGKFGKHMLNDFYVDKTYINLNHGSFGYTPKTVFDFKHQLERRMQFNTERWFRHDMEVLLAETRAFIAKRVNCSKQIIFMVQNATDAFNGLMKSLRWKQGDVVLLPNTGYPSIRKTLEWLRDYYKIQILDVNFTLDDLKTPESIQLKIEDTVNQFPKKIRCAVIDHISSMPSVVFPIYAIKLFLQQKGIDMFVDGAHSMSQVDIDIGNLQCDAYFSTLHKWSFSPKNSGFIFISDKYSKDVRPAITANLRGQGIAKQYFWTGTRDCTAYMCAQKGIEYLQALGYNEMKNYNHNMVLQGAKLMAGIWKTDLISCDQRCIGYMANIFLPSNDEQICAEIQQQLNLVHNIYMINGKFQGQMYTRICGQIYNELSDYRKAAEMFLQLLKKKQSQKRNNSNGRKIKTLDI